MGGPKCTSLIRDDVTMVAIHFPKSANSSIIELDSISPPSRDCPSFKIWNSYEKKIKLSKSVKTISIPFSLDDYTVLSVDPGEQSMGVRCERLKNGNLKSIYESTTFSTVHDEYSRSDVIEFIKSIKTTGVDLFIIESQINPDMIYIQQFFVFEMLSRGILCIEVQSRLKSYVFECIKGESLKKNSIEFAVALLSEEGDSYTLDQLDTATGKTVEKNSKTVKIPKQKVRSDLTDPVIMTRALHVHLVNYAVGIQKN